MSEETYVDVLRYSSRRTLLGLNVILLIAGAVLASFIAFSLSNLLADNNIGDNILSFFVLMLYFFIFIMIVMFIEYFFSIGLFYSQKTRIAGFLVFIGISFSFGFSLALIKYTDKVNVELVSTLYFLSTLASLGNGVFFLLTASGPKTETDIRRRFDEIKEEIAEKKISDMKIDEALRRAERWIINKQRDDGTWGEKEPLFETASVGRMFLLTNRGPDYSWIKIVDGNEEMRTVEQIYYLVLEALETASIQETYQSLLPVLFTLTVNNEIINFDDIAILEQRAKLANFSEWDFVSQLEKKEAKLTKEIPPLVALGPIFKYMEDYEGAQIVADILANTFNIIMNRSVKRFASIEDDTEIPMLIIGALYNSLVELLEREPYSKAPEMYGNQQNTLDMLGISLPSQGGKIKAEVRLGRVREYLKSNQEIDGSWDGTITATAECLRAIAHGDSIESNEVKFATYFLIAQQKPDGSWNNDIVTTTQVIKALWAVQSRIIIH